MNHDEPIRKKTGPSPAEIETLPSAPAASEDVRCDGLLAGMIAGFGVAETLAAVAFMEKDQLFFVVFALAGLIPWLGLAWMALRVARSGCSVLVILLAAMPMILGTLVCHFGLASSMREFGGLAYIYATVGLFLIAGAASGVILLAEGIAGSLANRQRCAAELQNMQNLPPGKPAVIPPPRTPAVSEPPPPDFSEPPPPKHEQP